MGIKTVAVHSTADADAMHVRLADETVCIGPPPATESYLNIPNIISAAEIVHADAIHPGYGFLSRERAVRRDRRKPRHHLGRAQARAHPHDGRQDRGQAHRRQARPAAGSRLGRRDRSASSRRKQLAEEIGYPVLIKAASGGGGRGMKVVPAEDQLESLMSQAAAEARSAFGDDTVYMEKYLADPRHIEFQVFGDGKGGAIHLGERDCSLQRRHQKVLEEAPSPVITPEERARMGEVVAQGDERNGLSRRRHDRVPLRKRRILLHRDEHPAPGRASGDRDDQRHRPRPRADPRRLGRGPVAARRTRCSSTAMRSNAGSTPRTRRPSRPRPAW